MLHIVDLDFDYQDTPLLSKVEFQVPAGGLLHIQGGNGVGKTTLLKLITGLYQPQNGAVHFEGQNIQQQLPYYLSQLCYVGDQPGIHSHLTLRENCLYDRQFDSKIHCLDALAAIFQLTDKMDIPCTLLSAGQQRQVGLLRLWMTKARLWLLDEPLVALDERAIHLLIAHMEQHRQRGGSIILTSHQPLPEALQKYQVYQL